MHPRDLAISSFDYMLPEERIALHPLPERDASRLLLYQNGTITQDIYRHIARHIPAGMLMVFNDTRVIHARILFQKSTGGAIEIFCIEPAMEDKDYAAVMATTGHSRWKCMVGGASKWKKGALTRTATARAADGTEFTVALSATTAEQLEGERLIDFSWEPARCSFAEILDLFGDVPLPPYIKRPLAADDHERYQTVYARHAGSVAAPTAGLHFTETVLQSLRDKNIPTCFVTLHVGAGTFRPVKSATMDGHSMHAEWIDVDRAAIEGLLQHLGCGIVAVGTTSVRTLESLYWMGVRVHLNPDMPYAELALGQWDCYEAPLPQADCPADTAITALLAWMERGGYTRIVTTTQLIIAPGYRYRMIRAMVTNFHQPQSTLLLLVAAALGDDWKAVYAYALDKGFRMLSYGDGSLLFVRQ